ncbi:hypothetical protein ACFV2N_43705 [Streptomyces sp. NPDC059680]|uniref:hypothetical protein n=1 Tax=Streptomyces sp. NPDC059680 TaxID=3346904 RepID=UPI00367B7447
MAATAIGGYRIEDASEPDADLVVVGVPAVDALDREPATGPGTGEGRPPPPARALQRRNGPRGGAGPAVP